MFRALVFAPLAVIAPATAYALVAEVALGAGTLVPIGVAVTAIGSAFWLGWKIKSSQDEVTRRFDSIEAAQRQAESTQKIVIKFLKTLKCVRDGDCPEAGLLPTVEGDSKTN